MHGFDKGAVHVVGQESVRAAYVRSAATCIQTAPSEPDYPNALFVQKNEAIKPGVPCVPGNKPYRIGQDVWVTGHLAAED